MKTLRVVCCLLVLAACGGAPSDDLYVLRTPDNQTGEACKNGRTLTVEKPVAAAEYAGKRIVVMQSGSHLNYYTGAAWAAPFPAQLQDFLIDALDHSGGFDGVNSTAENDVGMITLTTIIRAAEVTGGDQPVAHLRLVATLRDSSTAALIARVNIDESVPASENHMPAIIDAFDIAAAHAAAKIAHAASACSAHHPKHPRAG
jgi:ABC-type uncharacterized transport system auxiliary subunit